VCFGDIGDFMTKDKQREELIDELCLRYGVHLHITRIENFADFVLMDRERMRKEIGGRELEIDEVKLTSVVKSCLNLQDFPEDREALRDIVKEIVAKLPSLLITKERI
jgi:hypothetical protein